MIVPVVISLNPNYNNKKYMWNYIKAISFCKEYGYPLITQTSYCTGVLDDKGFFSENLCEHFEYEEVTQEVLNGLEIYEVPQDVQKRYIDKFPSQTDAYLHSIRGNWPEMEEVFGEFIKKIESVHGKIDAFLILENCNFLNKTAQKYDIEVINFEWGPFRPSAYRKTAYFNFGDIVPGLEKRYKNFIEEKDVDLPILTNEEILSIFLEDEYLDYTSFRHRKPRFEYGVALPSSNIEPCCAYNMITSEEIKTKVHSVSEMSKVCWRPHPFDKSLDGEAEVQVSKHSSAIDFILDCGKIISASSNIAFETMLLDRVSYDLGYSHYSFMGNSSLEDQKDNKPDLVFLNYVAFAYLVPYELVHNDNYIKYRLTKPSETELFLFHLKYYLATLGLSIEILESEDRLEYILKSRESYYDAYKADFIKIDFCDKGIQRKIEGFVEKKREKSKVKNENAELKRHLEQLQAEIEQYRKNMELLANDNMHMQKELVEKAEVWDDVMSAIPAVEKIESKLIRERNDDLNIDEVRKLISYYEAYHGKKLDCMYVYYDIGNGINETDKMRIEYVVENDRYSAKFILPDDVKMIRIDLCESGEKMLYFDNLKINGKNDVYAEYNIQIVDGKHTFLGKYPYIVLKEVCQDINVEFELFSL